MTLHMDRSFRLPESEYFPGAQRKSGSPSTTELKKPRIRLGSVIGLLGAVGVGVVVGRSIP